MKRKGNYVSGSFPQRKCEFFTAESGLISSKALCLACTGDGTVYIGTDCGLSYTKADGSFGSFACPPVESIFAAKDGRVFFSCGKTLYIVENGSISEMQSFKDEIVGISGEDRVFLMTPPMLYVLDGGEFVPYLDTEMPAKGLSCGCGRIVSFSERSLMVFAGKRKHWMCIFPEHSTMPEFKINCVSFDKELGFIWLGTDKGAYIYDNGCGWYGHNEINALPAEEIFSIDFTDDGRVILGTEAGLAIIADGKVKHLPATRWVCEEKVNAAVACKDGIWTATDSGVTKISEQEMTLRKKADYFFDLAEKYYIRKLGYITRLLNVKDGDLSTGTPQISDNDGLWTHTYLASLAYCYAVTGDEKVLEAARRSMNAMIFLTKVSGIKGFTARAVRFEGEPGYGKNLDMQIDGGEWHKSPDGKCEWLGETSSDEMTGHFFGFSLYYDLCADDEEKETIKGVICDIVDHILENNYHLCDIDGLPTTWACWEPAELNGNSMWLWEKCVNSLEILTFLDVAYHMSGDEKYRRELLKLATKDHYLLNAAQHKKADGRVTHIDDNLAFLCTATILRIEKDPFIRAYILMGMRHHWEYERPERCVTWNLMYGAFTDDVCDLDSAVQALRDLPLDYVNYYMLNSKRKDLVYDTEQEKWGGGKQLLVPLAADERPLANYDTNPFRFDGGNSSTAQSPSSYLLPYWFGRYYGIIDEAD